MDLKELKTKKDSDLHSLLIKWRDDLRELRFKDSNKQLKNVKEIKKIKKNVARILTLLNLNNKKKELIK